jgi:tRNA threonylcarbamoyladenosine biosynthesis protein TsaE
MEKIVKTLKDTEKLAAALARKLCPGMVLALNGDLGAGKTTFIKYLIRHSGNQEIVTSPTFVILNIYPGRQKFYHFDFYRLNSLADIESVGGEEFIPASDGVTLIEWAEKIPEILPENYLRIDIKIKSANSRSVKLNEIGKKAKILTGLKL